ncbi:hypothetical protein QJS10_CPA08g01352 [Acorus calamus]|uniref:UMP kinase n=1 Tax=Acorus calamus TaxID=4465 RepID=A0AAV9EC12_ACOCL|nr:hypothetical protein QJS10_CPA08g01352 [Acorus calamus]
MEVTMKKKKTTTTVCQKCGDKGYPELLIYCVKCHVSAEHRGSFDVSLWKCGPFKAHLSIKACQKVVDVAKNLPKFLHVEEHHLSRDEWPQSLQITPPTDENIGLYFFPERHKKRLNMLEKAARDKTLRVILDDAELLVFSSYVLPQQHQKFLGKFYLWGLFRRKQLPMHKQPTEYVFSNTIAKRKLCVSDDSIETRVPLGADKSTDQSTCESREENVTDEDRDATHARMKAPLQASCLNLFPLVVEDMAVQSKMGPSIAFVRPLNCCSSSSSSPHVGSLSDFRYQTATMMPFGLTADENTLSKPPYKWQRVLLKVSGEALAGDNTQTIDPKITMSIAREVASVTRLGVEVAIVVGGGNIFRGASWAGSSGLDRSSADYIGMLATVMNAIFLQATMESIGIPTRVQTAFRMSEVAEPYIRRRAVRHLEKGRVVIFAAGTGNPFFTTDTAAALRCAEKVVLKATNVDGVFDDDPRVNPNARLLELLSYQDVTSKDLSVMDMTAITLCQENNIPVVVFNLNKTGNISKAIVGDKVGTLISGARSSTQATPKM